MQAENDENTPFVNPLDTVDALVRSSKRRTHFPLRHQFLQVRNDDSRSPGPLAYLVRRGDHRSLTLYLLAITKASREPFDTRLPASVWARALGLSTSNTESARSSISRTWHRLEVANLIRRQREDRMAKITLLSEDGSGSDYAAPDKGYFKVSLALWLAGPVEEGDNGARWFQVLSLPELAVLLIACSLGPGFRLPQEKASDWYGISADTVGRGLRGLSNRGLLSSQRHYRQAPLSPLGYTWEVRHTLADPFRISLGSSNPDTTSGTQKDGAQTREAD